MPYYMTQVSLSAQTVQGYVASPTNRTAAIETMVQSVGGTLHQFFYALGEYDAVLITELPDNSAAAALALAAADSGAVSDMKTTALLTADEAVKGMQGASAAKASYKLPGS